MAATKQAVKATVNLKKNRLYLTISGNVDGKALEKLYTDVRFCVADLKEGFEVISDISEGNLIYLSGFPIFKKIIDFLIANKVGEIVRTLKNNSVIFHQVSNFSDKVLCYRTIYAESKDEAEQKLSELARRDGLRFRLNNVPFSFEYQGENGTGTLKDISVSGCAIEAATITVAEGSEIVLAFEFSEHETIQSCFKINGKIVRVEDKIFAVHFTEYLTSNRAEFYKRLSHEVNQISFVL